MKSFCIKTNNKELINYLLKELEYFDMNNIYVSIYKFKLYQNIIIHYTGKHKDEFLKNISTILAYTIIDFYEPKIIKNLINSNYFYFSTSEKKAIYNLCLNNVDMCVNKFIIDREYHEFISLLKLYISSSESTCDVIHLIYQNEESILLNSSKKIIKPDTTMNSFKYLSDISFSSNDLALNTLLTLLPKKLYIHIIDKEDDFTNTLKLIFDDRVFVCNDCSICNLYKLKAKV